MDTNGSLAPDDLSALIDDFHIRVVIVSYGVLHHDAPTGDAITVDLTTALRNPPEDPAVREQMIAANGLDKVVRDYVLATPGARSIIEATAARTLAMLTGYAEPRGQLVRVHVYCQGGRHRSVVVAEETAAWLRAKGIGVEVEHRHIGRPVVRAA
jgi:RNase adaptor protein for sRNA GlmZ degradation